LKAGTEAGRIVANLNKYAYRVRLSRIVNLDHGLGFVSAGADTTTKTGDYKSDPFENGADRSDRFRNTTFFHRPLLACIGENMFESSRILITRIFAAVLLVFPSPQCSLSFFWFLPAYWAKNRP
jgi:hypothetical protein